VVFSDCIQTILSKTVPLFCIWPLYRKFVTSLPKCFTIVNRYELSLALFDVLCHNFSLLSSSCGSYLGVLPTIYMVE
jgi:hypothetical protein